MKDNNVALLTDEYRKMIAAMLINFLRENMDLDEIMEDPEDKEDYAKRMLGFYDHFKDCLDFYPGDKREVEEYIVPYYRMFADGTTVYPVE